MVPNLDPEPARLLDREPPIPAEFQRIIRKLYLRTEIRRYHTIKDLPLDIESLRLESQLSAEHQRRTSSASLSTTSGSCKLPQTTRSTVTNTAAEPSTTSSRSSIKWVLAGVGALILAIAVAGYFYSRRTARPAIDSIAVLPLCKCWRRSQHRIFI